jgi:hypothetical protein
VSESRSVVSKSRDNACWPTRFSMPLSCAGSSFILAPPIAGIHYIVRQLMLSTLTH